MNIYSVVFFLFNKHVFRHIVGIPIGTHCVPLINELCLFCYKCRYIALLQENIPYISLFYSTAIAVYT